MKKILNTALLLFVLATVPVTSMAVAKDWSGASIKALKSHGVMVGYPDGTIKKKEYATREEMAVALDRAIQLPKVYVIRENNWMWIILVGLSSLTAGLTLGLLLNKKKVVVEVPVVNVPIPEIKILAVGIPMSGDVVQGGVSGVADKKKKFKFEEEKYKPSAEEFKEELTSKPEVNINVKSDRGGVSKDSLKKDIDKLSKLNI